MKSKIVNLKSPIGFVFVLCACFILVACETAEDISYSKDHEVPAYIVLTDSLIVTAGQTVEIKVDVSDNAGLKKLVLSYSEWGLRQSISLAEAGFPRSYRFVAEIIVPADAAKEWTEDRIANNGATSKVTQQYHKLVLEATDVNMNVRNIPVFIRVI